MSKPAINLWANFLYFERLDPDKLDDQSVLKLMELCAKLATIRPPCIKMHKDKIESRRLVVTTAMDLGIDIMAMKRAKRYGGKKPAIGRGLLDVWNEEYKKRFGSIVGTPGAAEVIRRTIVTRMTDAKAKEKVASSNPPSGDSGSG